MKEKNQWLNWAVELQSLAQAGLTYGRDAYDRERYERIREISAEIMAHMTELPLEKVKDLFCNESGLIHGRRFSRTGGSSLSGKMTAGGRFRGAGAT